MRNWSSKERKWRRNVKYKLKPEALLLSPAMSQQGRTESTFSKGKTMKGDVKINREEKEKDQRRGFLLRQVCNLLC